MNRLCEGRIVIVTGAGRGIGREYALMLAEHGAKVVVNDLGTARDGEGSDIGQAQEVVNEIVASGGEAVANGANVADFQQAGELIQQAIDTYGRLDILVNNAGVLRDRMLVNMTEEEWDVAIAVNLKGTFCTSRHAAAYWRQMSKAGTPVAGRLINTTSISGIYGNVAQSNYGAAKSGVASFTIIAARELRNYGVTVNAIAPGALTRLTDDLGIDDQLGHPRLVAPIVTWLASEESSAITGRVFEARKECLAVSESWNRGPTTGIIDDPARIGDIVKDLVRRARLNVGMDGQPLDGDISE